MEEGGERPEESERKSEGGRETITFFWVDPGRVMNKTLSHGEEVKTERGDGGGVEACDGLRD